MIDKEETQSKAHQAMEEWPGMTTASIVEEEERLDTAYENDQS
jgi:hypothetical protein